MEKLRTHLVVMFELDLLIYVTTRFKHPKTVRPQDLEHRLHVKLNVAAPHKFGFCNAAGVGH